MTKDVIDRNRDLYIKEFNATGLPGVNHIISYLDSHHFFEAQCNGHDREPGGTANHSLWVLQFARETRESILSEHPEKVIPDDELVFTCLLHDVCDCNPGEGHGKRSKKIMEQRIKGFTFSKDVLAAVNAHMHGELNGKRSTKNSTTKAELLHYLVHNSDHRAIEYTSGIPFGTEPKNKPFYKKDIFPTTVFFDKNEQRYWWNNGGDFKWWEKVKKLEKLPATPAKVTTFLYIRQWPLEPDLAVVENEQGNKALFVVRYLSGFGLPTLLASDRAGFGYTKFIAYMSRFPQYRASYIVGRKTNGKWGIIAVKDQFAEDDDILIRITPKVDYEYDDPDSAINSMSSYKGYLTRVRHTVFYKKVVIKQTRELYTSCPKQIYGEFPK